MRPLTVAVLVAVAGASTASSQAITPEQTEQMVAAMRAGGASEADIQRALDGVKAAQAFAGQVEAGEAAGLSEEDAARRAAGFSDAEIAAMGQQDTQIAAMEQQVASMALQREIRAFEAENADKPVATVQLGNRTYELKTLTCERTGELFQIHAEGAPFKPRHKGPTLHASRSSAYGQGGTFEGLKFKGEDGIDVGVGKRTGEFVDGRFVFEADVELHRDAVATGDIVSLSVDVACD